jgi:hypothetical protein
LTKITKINALLFSNSHFFAQNECIELAEIFGCAAEEITTALDASCLPDVRISPCVMIDDVDRAESQWKRAALWLNFFGDNWQAFCLNERLRFHRDDLGRPCDCHDDGCYESPNSKGGCTTCMVYFNGEFDGRQTAFANGIVQAYAEVSFSSIYHSPDQTQENCGDKLMHSRTGERCYVPLPCQMLERCSRSDDVPRFSIQCRSPRVGEHKFYEANHAT